MNVLLWVLQVLLAVAFLAHGLLLLFPPAAIVDQMNASLSEHLSSVSAWPKSWRRWG
jgi:uncharacterized membrane protein YphA (DoxX/SURF4 family)